MGDVGDMYKEWGEEKKRRKSDRKIRSEDALKDSGLSFEVKNFGNHIILDGPKGKIDFWPTTGRWICRSRGKSCGGVEKLIKYVKGGLAK